MIGKVTYLLLPLFGRFFEHRLVEGALFPELLNGLQLFGQRRLDQLIDGFMSEVEIEACFDDGLQEAILGLPSWLEEVAFAIGAEQVFGDRGKFEVLLLGKRLKASILVELLLAEISLLRAVHEVVLQVQVLLIMAMEIEGLVGGVSMWLLLLLLLLHLEYHILEPFDLCIF